MPIGLLQIILLGLVQGAAELLPVSSSAHVIVAEKLMGLDPSSPEATFLLVMLHTGTMFAVLIYFWQIWIKTYFSSKAVLIRTASYAFFATALTGAVGLGLMKLIEKLFLKSTATGQIEELFGQLPLVATALACAGVYILLAAHFSKLKPALTELTAPTALAMGFIQGLSLPFRGFSRSGGTISTGLLLGTGQQASEAFSFLLAFVLTPAIVGRELLRLIKLHANEGEPHHLVHMITPGLLGMVASFIAGLFALKLLSRFLSQGRWSFFGFYCLAASALVFILAGAGL